jgi:hypothetical protein
LALVKKSKSENNSSAIAQRARDGAEILATLGMTLEE